MKPMTPDEQKLMEGKFLESKKIFFILSIGFGMGLLIISYIIFFHFQLNENNWYLKLIPGMVLALDIVVLYFVVYPTYRNFKSDYEGKQKEVIHSQIAKTEKKTYKNSVSYFWILANNQKLSVDESQFLAYPASEDLVFHFAPNSKTLLSVEKQEQF